jgi:acyl carrier protein
LAAERYSDFEQLAAAPTPPDLVLADCSGNGEGSASPPLEARDAAARVLELLQQWIAEERLAGSRLALLTRGAVAVDGAEAPDPAGAALWGLVRTAQAEHPGRFCLIDVEPGFEATSQLVPLLAAAAEEPQLALREGVARAPRLMPLAPQASSETPAFDPDRTVLICDGEERLGTLIAEHLVTAHGVGNLLLAYVDEGGAEPQVPVELERLGADVRVARWDPADRGQMGELISSIDPAHPLGAVVHAARALDDGVLESLDRDRLERALRPRAYAAWHLHELTREIDLSQFLLISCATGTVGSAAQANYTAANAFLDAVAACRRAEGLPATSLAWGPIEPFGASRELNEAMRARLARTGLLPLSPARALEQLEQALPLEGPFIAPIDLDRGALRAQVRLDTLPSVLRELAPVARRGEGARATLAERLAASPWEERQAIALEAVREHIAVVLGHRSAQDVESERPFQELGFDSLTAVELRNRLGSATGLRLPPTLAFDYPTPAALASYLAEHCAADGSAAAPEQVVEAALAALDQALVSVGGDGGARQLVSMRLRAALASVSATDEPESEVAVGDLAEMSHEEVFALIDEEIGDG